MPQDNFVQPFQLESSSIRGRIVRVGDVLDTMLGAHNYPLPIAHLVAETTVLALALSSMMKYEGIFTLQAQGDGPVKMLVADVTSDGAVRACASFDPERFESAREKLSALKTIESDQNHLAQYLGKGYIAFTVDQGQHTDRYQGIVELRGSSMVDCVQHYFTQSEQIGTGIKMAVGQRDGEWRAEAIMLQNMPEDESEMAVGNLDEDDWRRSMVLLDSCTEDEFLAPDIGASELLLRLFHEEGVRVFDRRDIFHQCRCDEDRVRNILISLEEDEIKDAGIDGILEMVCEFCSNKYVFSEQDILKAKAKS